MCRGGRGPRRRSVGCCGCCSAFRPLAGRALFVVLVGDLVLHGAPGTRFRVFGSVGGYDVDAFDGQADELMAGGSPTASGDAWGVVPRER
jgi:hypothetical protein